MDKLPPRSLLIQALHAHRTALAALGGFSLNLSRCFGDVGSKAELDKFEMAMRHVIETRKLYDRLVHEMILRDHMGSVGGDGRNRQN
jgi:hypothetical protein